jgi:CRP-like cAMP-binding protein
MSTSAAIEPLQAVAVRLDNALFFRLSAEHMTRVSSLLERVPMRLGQVLYESGEAMSHAYFPIDCIVSLLYVMESGESAEIAVVGNEGMVGIALFMGGESTMSRAVVQNAGHAYRMPAAALTAEFQRNHEFSRSLLTFALTLINQMTQTAACNRHHTLDQQLCRWMLMSLDRLPDARIEMTGKLIGNMLGISAAAAGAAASALQDAGIADYADGVIRVLDRDALELRSCECYAAVRREDDRLLPPARSSANTFQQASV